MKVKNFIGNHFGSLGLSVLTLSLTACGGGAGGGAANFSGLQDLPDASQMVSTSPSSTSLTRYAVTGTPPTLQELTELGDDDFYEYFWGQMVADLSDETPSCGEDNEYRHLFWGNPEDEDNYGGMGACNMAEGVGRSFGEILNSSGSLCYMKNIPSLESSTVEGFSGDPSTIFAQAADDFTVRVEVKGMSPGEEEEEEEIDPDAVQQYVFIKVKGSNTVGSDVYAVDLWFCQPGEDESLTLTGAEEIEVNKSTGAFTSTSTNSEERGSSNFSLSATLKEENGVFTYDSTADRVVNIVHTHTDEEDRERIFKAKITIDSNNYIYNNMYEIGGEDDEWKRYSVSRFSGTNVQNVRFLEAAVIEAANQHNGDGFTTAVEYRENGYYSALDSALSELVADVDFDSGFYSGTPEVDLSNLENYDCDTTADYEVTMDFGEEDVAAVAEICDGRRMDNLERCWSDTIQEAIDNLNDEAVCENP